MDAYASGQWKTRAGQDREFVRTWREWFEWNQQNVEGLKWAKLLRSADDARRFVSISAWESETARTGWMAHEGFRQWYDRVSGFCDEAMGGNFIEEVAIQTEHMMAGTR